MIKKLLLLNYKLLLARLACCAPKVLTGKVQDNMGDPLPGLSFLMRGTSMDTVSFAKGGYSLFLSPVSPCVLFYRKEYILN